MKEIKLGKIFGVEIDVTYNWFFIFALVTISLTAGIFPTQLPGLHISVYGAMGIVTSLLFFASLLTHELMHSVVANRSGIPIKKITLFVFGGMAQMSGEPGDARSEFRMAVVGPGTSFALAGGFYLLAAGLRNLGMGEVVAWPMAWLAEVNLFLAVFNLLPGFPLDGGRIFRSMVWWASGDMDKATSVASKIGQLLAAGIMTLGLWLFFFGGNVGGIWLVLIGWFLYQSAVGSYRQMLLQHALQNVKVRDIMSRDVKTVSPHESLVSLVDDYFMKYRFSRFPVLDAGDVLGVVTLQHVKEVPREDWEVTLVSAVLDPLSGSLYVGPDEQAVAALMKMAKEGTGHLLVMDESRLVGIVTRADLMRLISIRMELAAGSPVEPAAEPAAQTTE